MQNGLVNERIKAVAIVFLRLLKDRIRTQRQYLRVVDDEGAHVTGGWL